MRPMRTGLKPGGGNLMENESLAPAVEELWSTWEIHSMILVSLFLQVFLFLFAGWRRRCASACVRTVLWLAYVSADSVAVFVLGHLAVHVSEPGHQLMSFWAPFLLVHLGGQDTITAFSIEDNELWRRHLLNMAIQVAVAGYVVCKASWPDHRLKMAMVLMFICGSSKYAERILYLYLASPGFLTNRKAWRVYWQGKDYDKLKKDATEHIKHTKRTLIKMSKGSSPTSAIDGLMEGISLTTDIMAGKTPVNKVASITLADEGKLPNMLADFLSKEDRHRAYEHVGALLVHCYRVLYTKSSVRDLLFDFKGWFSTEEEDRRRTLVVQAIIVLWRIFVTIFWMLPILFMYVATPIALALFMDAEKGASLGGSTGRGRADIMVSYVLLVGALVLDVCSVANIYFSRPCCSSLQQQWSETLGQYDIIKSADMPQFWRICGMDVDRPEITKVIKEFILDSLVAAGTRKEWNIASTRGQLALHEWTALTTLKESIRSGVDFPTSVLILHIATGICNEATNSDGLKKQAVSIELSNYIMYLVFKCDVMLTTTSQVVHHKVRMSIRGISRQINRGEIDKDAIMERFSQEINKLEQGGSKEREREELKEQDEIQIEIIENEESKEQDEIQIEHDQESAKNDSEPDNHMKKLHQSAQVLYSPQALLRSACSVAQELNSIEDEDERWNLIAAVWAEMIYYTAPRCGAAFHHEHLSEGGEFITHVLVLMFLLGPFMPPPDA